MFVVFFFPDVFLKSLSLPTMNEHKITTKQALLTQEPSGDCKTQERAGAPGDVKWTFPSLECFLWPFVDLMHLTWIKLF